MKGLYIVIIPFILYQGIGEFGTPPYLGYGQFRRFKSCYPDQWGMGLLGVVVALAMRIADGFKSHMLHQNILLVQGIRIEVYETSDWGSNPQKDAKMTS